MIRERLKRIVEGTDSKLGQTFDYATQLLIVVSLVTFSIETLPGLSENQRYWLWMAEMVTVLIFTAEYLLRVFVADRPWKFVFSFFGIVDLLAILPFYLAIGIDLRSIRAFRMIRLFRILKLARYSSAMRRFHIAFILAKEEIILFSAIASILFFLSATGIYYFERDAQPEKFASIFHSLWWSAVTLTTVGYGDSYPITTGGKVFTCGILVVGLGIVSVPPGLVAAALSQARKIQSEEKQSENVE